MPSIFVVFGASGGTGQHFVRRALADGHTVRAIARTPSKLTVAPNLEVIRGSITEPLDLDKVLSGATYVVAMLGEKDTQSHTPICRNFVEQLVPAMRRQGVKRFMFQAGAMSKPYDRGMGVVLWIMRRVIARPAGYEGQHRDNEKVMEYLATQGNDIEWMVHLAGISGEGPSKGKLQRTDGFPGVAPFIDTADYNYRTVQDAAAVRKSEYSTYGKSG